MPKPPSTGVSVTQPTPEEPVQMMTLRLGLEPDNGNLLFLSDVDQPSFCSSTRSDKPPLSHHLDPTITPTARLIALNRDQLPVKSPTGG
jgi:hypothetical protein